MSGQINLSTVLQSLQISCDDIKYGFASVKEIPQDLDSDEVLGTFKENEGLTIFATKRYFEANKIPHDGPYAKLTMEVHTALALVGFTAAFSRVLTEYGISANVIAGYFHDHVFVQYDLRQKAIDAINSLKK
jgi:uncharacterized protein